MIKELLHQLLHDNEEMYSKVCTVETVDGLTCDVLPVDGDAPVLDVRLTVNPDATNYFAVIPKVGSLVIVTFLNKDVAFVSLVDEPDKLVYKSGDLIFEVTDKFKIQKGVVNLGTLMTDLTQEVINIYAPKNVAALTLIKTKFTQLLS
jgi:hypothetical protein